MGITERNLRVVYQKELRQVSLDELEQLVEKSIGAFFLSDHSYNEIAGNAGKNFKPWQFDPIRVVRVQTSNGPKLLIQDGHHRAKAYLDIAKQHPEQLAEIIKSYGKSNPKQRDWRPTVLDVTENYLTSPPPKEQLPTISMHKYFEILAPHTKKQAEVLTKRTGIYTMNYWPSIADPQFEKRLPAFAALALLDNPEIKADDETDFIKNLIKTTLFDNDTQQQRQQHIESLTTLRRFLADVDITPSSVLTFARELIAKLSPRIGGEEEAKKHFIGLSSLPQIEEKREKAEPTDRDIHIDHSLHTAFSNLPATLSTKINYMRDMQIAIENRHLSLAETDEVIRAKSPSKEYKDLLAKKELESRVAHYKSHFEIKEELSRTELDLLRKSLEFDAIRAASHVVTQADQLIPTLSDGEQKTNLETLLNLVTRRPGKDVDNIVNNIKAILASISPTPKNPEGQTLIMSTPELERKLAEAQAALFQKDAHITELTAKLAETKRENAILRKHLQNIEADKQNIPVTIFDDSVDHYSHETDWTTLPFNDSDGKEVRWFFERFKLGNTELLPLIRKKVTLMIDQAAKKVFPNLELFWDDILDNSRDKNEYRGLDALDHSFTNRLALLTHVLKWDKTKPEFLYLSATHFLLNIQTQINLLETQSPTPQHVSLKNLARYKENMEKQLQVFKRKNLPTKSDAYLELLQYLLYTSPRENPETISSIRNGQITQKVALLYLDMIKQNSGCETMEQIFTQAIMIPQKEE